MFRHGGWLHDTMRHSAARGNGKIEISDLHSGEMVFPIIRVRDLLREPAWREEDTGEPLPDSPHACLVCLPTWDSVLGYEEERPDVIARLKAGYPRFFLQPLVAELFTTLGRRLGAGNDRAVVFPRQSACERAARFVTGRGGEVRGIKEIEGVWALVVPEASYPAARVYWWHTGEIVSSRQAEDIPTNK